MIDWNKVGEIVGTTGLAVVLVLAGARWITTVLVPKYLQGIQEALRQNTSAIEVQSAVILAYFRATIPGEEFEKQLDIVKRLRTRAANGHSEK